MARGLSDEQNEWFRQEFDILHQMQDNADFLKKIADWLNDCIDDMPRETRSATTAHAMAFMQLAKAFLELLNIRLAAINKRIGELGN